MNLQVKNWLESKHPTILGICIDRVIQDKIILDSIILSRNIYGWNKINDFIKFPTNEYNTIFLNHYNEDIIPFNLTYAHPYLDRLPSLES
tara:strand:+ start:419 stop:688 length:270 start_codon:yes stop_codon:yes gene_type:complete